MDDGLQAVALNVNGLFYVGRAESQSFFVGRFIACRAIN